MRSDLKFWKFILYLTVMVVRKEFLPTILFNSQFWYYEK